MTRAVPPAPETRSRWSARRVAAIAGALVVVLALLEIGARVVAHVSHRERGLVLDERLGWRPAPNVSKRGAWWGAAKPARTNALGFRDRERAIAKPPGARRVLILGDSFVFGVGVDDGERVSDVLERELGCETWNLGVTAYGPDQELLLLESDARGFAPDVVVWCATFANDVEDVRCERRYGWPKPWFELDARDRLVPHAPSIDPLVRLRNASYLVELALAPFDGRRNGDRVCECWRERDAVPLFGALAAAIAERTRELGARFVAVEIPADLGAHGVDPALAAHDAPLRTELVRRGIDALDLRPTFVEALEHGEQPFLLDGHWNAAGHTLAAHAIAARLRAE